MAEWWSKGFICLLGQRFLDPWYPQCLWYWLHINWVHRETSVETTTTFITSVRWLVFYFLPLFFFLGFPNDKNNCCYSLMTLKQGLKDLKVIHWVGEVLFLSCWVSDHFCAKYLILKGLKKSYHFMHFLKVISQLQKIGHHQRLLFWFVF